MKRPHRIYDHDEIDPVLDYLSTPDLPYGAIAQIARDTGIPQQTLSDWRVHRRDPTTPDWFPLAMGHPAAHVLSPEASEAIASTIRNNFIATGRAATRRTVADLALNSYASLPVEEMRRERFCASNSFVTGFLAQQRLSLRTPHAERRTDVDENDIGRFLRSLEAARSAYPAERIFNFDETSWRTYLAPHRILAEKGTDAIKLKTVRNEKETFTGFGCISASGEKLPFWVLTKGKTDRSHLKFGQHPDVVFRHTTNGWTTEEMFTEYLTWLSLRCDGEPFFLVLDIYPTHRTQKVRDHAAGLMIHLQFVPAGATGRVQPLDRRVFGELKSRARLGFRRLAWQTGEEGANPDQTISILVEAWNAISGENVRKAWQFE